MQGIFNLRNSYADMNILFSISHPAHIHFFRNSIPILKLHGHKVTVVARDKDVTLELLDNYGIEHTVLTSKKGGIFGSISELFQYQIKLYDILIRRKIDLILSIGAVLNAHISKVLGIPCFQFYDTEHAWFQNFITYPFISKIFTPSCFEKRMGWKHLVYEGYHELAYLHPNYFEPDSTIRERLKVLNDEKYIVFRFIAWDATHDWGKTGFSLEDKKYLVKELSKYVRVFITSESELSQDLEAFKLKTPSHLIHDVLSFASLYIGEGATMASESAVLGTPAIYVNPLTAGTIREQENQFGLLHHFNGDAKGVLNKALELLSKPNLNEDCKVLRNNLLSKRIDVTEFIVSCVDKMA